MNAFRNIDYKYNLLVFFEPDDFILDQKNTYLVVQSESLLKVNFREVIIFELIF